MTIRRIMMLACFLSAPYGEAAAQQVDPIGRFVVDARGAFARYPESAEVAVREDVNVSALPSRGLGLTAGAHVYLARWRVITFGIGGELHFSRGRRAPEEPETPTTPVTPPQTPPAPAAPQPPTFTTRFRAVSPQLSFNFGKSDGWSYISGGIGRITLTTEADRAQSIAVPDVSRKAINYGGGARWFTSEHLAFSLDVRVYAISPAAATETTPAALRTNLLVINAGVSFK